MSRAKDHTRTGQADFYPTPAWCVHRLFDVWAPPGGRWLEPAVGNGAIVDACPDIGQTWTTVDIRDTGRAGVVGDYTSGILGPAHFQVIISNPPYNQALAFVKESIKRAQVTVMLLRVNWLASQKRHKFLVQHTPSLFVLPNRPSFTGNGTDATDYAWMIWSRANLWKTVNILPLTPADERRGEERRGSAEQSSQPI